MARQIVKLPLNSLPYYNVDEKENSLVSNELINAYVNEAGHTVKRPGYTQFVSLGTGEIVDSVFWWDEGQVVIAVSNSRVFCLEEDGTKTELAGADLLVGKKVSFVNVFYQAENKNYLFFANGRRINYTDGSANIQQIADPGAPKYVSWLASVDGILLAQDDVTKLFRWAGLKAGIQDPFVWPADNGIRPSIQGDDLVALILNNNKINLFGKRTLEVYWNSGADPIPFSRIDGASLNFGVLAPKTIQNINGSLTFLEELRRVMSLGPTVISQPIDRLMQDITNIEEARAFWINILGIDFYVMVFPGNDEVFVHDVQSRGWFKWQKWDKRNAVFKRFPINDYTYAKDWNKRLFASSEDDSIFELKTDAFDDDGDPIRIVRRLGSIDHGTFRKKQSYRFIFKVKRGFDSFSFDYLSENGNKLRENGELLRPPASAAKQEINATLSIRWRDDGWNAWSNSRTVPLKNEGNSEFFVWFDRMGVYRSREWEFTYQGATPFILMEAFEEIEVSDG